MPLSREDATRMAVKMYDCRKVLVNLHGRQGFLDRAARWRETIVAAMNSEGVDVLTAAIRVAKVHRASAMSVMTIFATALEMIEPMQD